MSFVARHGSDHSDAAARVLSDLEDLRTRLENVLGSAPGDIAVVMHSHPAALALAAPWLPLARAASAPAARRYYAGWFTHGEIHVLAPPALEKRASGAPGSREALLRSPGHEYAHLAIGATNPALPPPFSPARFHRYVRLAWLCEGAAVYLSGQAGQLRGAIARRLHEGGRPAFPPASRDALVLGGTVFALLEIERGVDACARLIADANPRDGRAALSAAFGNTLAEVERTWRQYLGELTQGG